jgi:hypothetical protein
MKIKEPNYVKLLIEKRDATEHALVSKELITTKEKARMNSLVRDLVHHFENKHIWVTPYGNGKLANISVLKYFITDQKELGLRGARRTNISLKVKFFDSSKNSLNFVKEKVTQSTANEFIKNWCQESDKGLGTEKDLSRDSFYYLNEIGGYSACDNSSGDCFCEDFKTETDACRYLDGWSIEEINQNTLKAYVVTTQEFENGAELIFADKPSKAKHLSTLAMNCNYIDLRAKREPKVDKYLDIAIDNSLDWNIPEHKKILETELGWKELN